MIVSPGRRYIFVHIPKTGGTSLSVALEGRAMKDDILIGDTPKALRRKGRLDGIRTAGRLWKHSRLADIEGLVAREAFDDFLVFTLVRNPWERVVSYYHWLRRQGFEHPAVTAAKAGSFQEFLKGQELQESLKNDAASHYVTDGAGVERAARFVRLEHLAEDLAPVEAHLGFRLGDIPHLNRSDRPSDYRAFYTDADAARVGRLCAADIARFGYGF